MSMDNNYPCSCGFPFYYKKDLSSTCNGTNILCALFSLRIRAQGCTQVSKQRGCAKPFFGFEICDLRTFFGFEIL